jgi:hypothetical protein
VTFFCLSRLLPYTLNGKPATLSGSAAALNVSSAAVTDCSAALIGNSTLMIECSPASASISGPDLVSDLEQNPTCPLFSLPVQRLMRACSAPICTASWPNTVYIMQNNTWKTPEVYVSKHTQLENNKKNREVVLVRRLIIINDRSRSQSL